MKRGKILGAALAAAVTVTALTGCTMSDQRIIDAFFEPKTIAQPEKTRGVEDPSMEAYRKAEKLAPNETRFTVKVYGSVRDAVIMLDASREPVQFLPYKNDVAVTDSIVITGVTKKKSGGCTILDAAGNIVEKQTAYGKNGVFTCIYTK